MGRGFLGFAYVDPQAFYSLWNPCSRAMPLILAGTQAVIFVQDFYIFLSGLGTTDSLRGFLWVLSVCIYLVSCIHVFTAEWCCMCFVALYIHDALCYA